MKNTKVVTAAQMKAIERAANEDGLLYIQMMENAGRAAWKELVNRRPGPGTLLVVAGKGNNGGDGLVMARLAAKSRWQVALWLAEGDPETPDALANWKLLKDLPVKILSRENPPAPEGWTACVDALYGTGFHGALRPAGASACALMNHCRQQGAFLLSVDLPSGVAADTGEAASGAVQADLTVAFDSWKPAHHVAAAQKYCGEGVLADIGISDQCHSVT